MGARHGPSLGKLLRENHSGGAVVVNGSGAVAAEGRGRRYEPSGPGGQLAGSHIAHAEINALAQLRAGRHYEDHLLLTTLEPCGMCHGAAVQATVGGVRYAGSDPYGGTGSLVFGTPQAQRRRLTVTVRWTTNAAAWLRCSISSGSCACLLVPMYWPPSDPGSRHSPAWPNARRRSSYLRTPPRGELAWAISARPCAE
jgi:tRNA(Arg) A34 adenosine deaminase TadA